MRGWWDGVLAAAIAAEFTAICACSGAMAQEQARTASVCSGEAIWRGSARRIVDGRSFVLDDGREVRLAAIEVPPLPLPQESGPAPGGVAAKDALTALLAGGGIVLKQAEQQKTDRYGRMVVYAFTVRRRTFGAGRSRCRGRRARNDPGRQLRLHRGIVDPRKYRTASQDWPLGRPLL